MIITSIGSTSQPPNIDLISINESEKKNVLPSFEIIRFSDSMADHYCSNEVLNFTIGNIKEANSDNNVTFSLSLFNSSKKADCHVSDNITDVICL